MAEDPHNPVASEEEAALTFYEMFREERLRVPGADSEELCGLGLSGGGIRSATFNLGVIQAMIEARKLSQFHYLSTVSGGGYVGSWLSALIHRCADGDVAKLEEHWHARGEGRQRIEAAVHFLRRYSNYLTPRVGIFGIDTAAAIAIYLRNFLLNLLMLVMALGALLMVPFVALAVFDFVGRTSDAVVLVMLGAIAWTVTAALLGTGAQAPMNRRRRPGLPYSLGASVFVGALLLAIALPQMVGASPGASAWVVAALAGAIAQLLLSGIAWFAWSSGSAGSSVWKRERRVGSVKSFATSPKARLAIDYGFAAALAGAAGGALLLAIASHTQWPREAGAYAALDRLLAIAYLTPVVALVVVATLWLQVGLARRTLTEQDREWHGRVSGYVLKGLVVWVMVVTLFLGTPVLFSWLADSETIKWSAVAGWVVTTISGVVLGKGQKTSGVTSNPARELIVQIAPYVFIVGLLIGLMQLDYVVVGAIGSCGGAPENLDGWHVSDALAAVAGGIACMGGVAAAAAIVGLAIALFLGFYIDINLFSFHQFYRNRLTRCFLGSTRFAQKVDASLLPIPPLDAPGRQPHEFTQLDPDDDLFMMELALGDKAQRPLHIVNTALNLVATRELAWQQRKAASFVFTPLHCGYQLPPQADWGHQQPATQLAGSYRRTPYYFLPPRTHSPFAQAPRAVVTGSAGMAADPEQVSGPRLGMTFAISGAAASPNMGYHSSPAVTFLLAVFNVRLGRWCGNTAVHPRWKETGPRNALRYLFAELLGDTHEASPFIYLSDGGHFENLGLYELVRRRCKRIVLSDASADPGFQGDDLANAVAKCRVDLGVTITFDSENRFTERMRPDEKTGLVKASFLKGTIDYGPGETPGELFYLKASLVSDLDVDIGNYAATHKTFPHETTVDQFFDETQFESYLRLGNRLGGLLAAEWRRPPPARPPSITA